MLVTSCDGNFSAPYGIPGDVKEAFVHPDRTLIGNRTVRHLGNAIVFAELYCSTDGRTVVLLQSGSRNSILGGAGQNKSDEEFTGPNYFAYATSPSKVHVSLWQQKNFRTFSLTAALPDMTYQMDPKTKRAEGNPVIPFNALGLMATPPAVETTMAYDCHYLLDEARSSAPRGNSEINAASVDIIPGLPKFLKQFVGLNPLSEP